MVKDVVILLGRGIEGCGVTKYTVELCKWLEQNNRSYTVIAAKDKRWARKECHSINNLEEYKFAKPDEIESIINRCNKADCVIVNSLPSKTNKRGKGHDEACIIGFKTILQKVIKPFVLIQHDHTHLSINRNEALIEAIEKSSVIFSHSETGDFSEVVSRLYAINGSSSLLSFFENEEKPFYTFQPGMDFDSLRSKYWLPIEQQDSKANKWIGRTTSWKGYNIMMNFHTDYLKPNGYLTTLEGIEKSPAFLDFKANHEGKYVDFITKMHDPNETDLTPYYGGHAACFSIYNNSEMLKRAAKTAFCYQLSILHPKFIKRSIEYTHCELVAVGTVPIFRKEYGDACKHRIYDKPLIECKNNGTIWLTESTMSECLNTINKLSSDNVMRNEYREMAYEFYKLHQDSSNVFDDLIRKIEQHV